MNQVRAERVANGSRRKRDVQAVAPPVQVSETRLRIEAWIAANLPGEDYHAVSAVRFRLKKQGQPITAESVREGLRERGWLKEERE